MEFLTQAIRRHFPDWNKRVHSVSELSTFSDLSEIIVKETDLISDLGEYRVHKKQPFIFIHKYAAENFKPWVFAHETGHFCLHDINSAKFSILGKNKVEIEANIFACVFFIPRHLVLTKTVFDLQYEYNYPKKLIMLRKNLFDTQNKF